MNIYALCPDDPNPIGGIKIIYRHVDVLRSLGHNAFVLHVRQGFRCTWFENSTPVRSCQKISFKHDDILIVPEIYGCNAANEISIQYKSILGRKFFTLATKGITKVIFNQNSNYTFSGHSLEPTDKRTPYTNSEVVASLVVSEKDKLYLESLFPTLSVHRIHNSIDSDIFYPEQKEKSICIMPRKNIDDLNAVINGVKQRGSLDGWKIHSLHNVSQAFVASKLRTSAIFLSTGVMEGFGLPPAEAMASGCIVVGYHGYNQHEFFNPKFSYPIQAHNIQEFTDVLNSVLTEYDIRRNEFTEKGFQASEFIHSKYSVDQEIDDIDHAWKSILS